MSSKKYFGNNGLRASHQALHTDSDSILNTLFHACDANGVIKGLSIEHIFKFSNVDPNKLYDGLKLLEWMQRQEYIKITYENDKPIYEILKKQWIKEFYKQKDIDKIEIKYQLENVDINSKILREYQSDIINTANNTKKNILIEAPTGSGKTIMGYYIAKHELDKGGSVLFITPKIILLDQTIDVFKALNPYKFHKTQTNTYSHNLFISTLQTIYYRGVPSKITLLIIDEAHYGHSGEMQKLIKDRYKGRSIALSATPYDIEGYSIKGYELHLNKYDINYMVSRGYLVPYTFFKVLNIYLDNIRTMHGDYNLSELSNMYAGHGAINAIVEGTKQKILNRQKVMVFAVNIFHCESLAKAYQEAGINTRAIHSKLKKKEQINILNGFKYGDIKILVSVEQLTLGFDAPIADTIVLARPTKSFNLYQQMFGRVLRPYKDKKEALLLDCAGVIESLGLPDKRSLPKNKQEYDLTYLDTNKYELRLRKQDSQNFLNKSKNTSDTKNEGGKKNIAITIQNNIINEIDEESLLSNIKKHTKEKLEFSHDISPKLIVPSEYIKTFIEQLTQNKINQKLEKPKILKNLLIAKRSTKIILKIRDFLYQNYQGHCQICGFTFSKTKDSTNYFEMFNWSDNRISKSKKFLTSADSLCLCSNCSNNIKWGAFRPIFIEELDIQSFTNLENIHELVLEIKDNDIQVPYNFQDLIDFDDIFPLKIELDGYIKHIFFTHEHLIQFIAYLQLEE